MLPLNCSYRGTQFILIIYFFASSIEALVLLSGGSACRRTVFYAFFESACLPVFLTSFTSTAQVDVPTENEVDINTENFISAAYGREEYTNSIVASRDTNISPAEAYDVIRQRIPLASDPRWGDRKLRAADLGAGAGLSTTILYAEKGYRNISAVDWSRLAWDTSVAQNQSGRQSVLFYEMDDDSFFSTFPAEAHTDEHLFDVIVYNFAINKDKAAHVARSHLSVNGLLLAPCNDRNDYWYKQSYILFDQTGSATWTSDAYLDAWSIQFQPDVTSPSCTGIWCGNFNGYFDKKKQKLDKTADSRK